MAKKKKDRRISRRDFLRLFPGLMSEQTAYLKAAIPKGVSKLKAPKGGQSRKPGVRIPALGTSGDGVPLLDPWFATAYALVGRDGRGRSLPFLMGATGEAFCFYYSTEDPAAVLAQRPGNSFIAALAVGGLSGRAASGGPIGPAAGGVEVSLAKGFTVVIGTPAGPAIVALMAEKDGRARLVRPGKEPEELSMGELEAEWEAGAGPMGPEPFYRIAVESLTAPEPAEIIPPALDSMAALLRGHTATRFAAGVDAWRRLAEDVESERISVELGAELLPRLLSRVAVARLAAGSFLMEVSPAVPGEEREGVEAAARIFRKIHVPSIQGEMFGTGLLPEAADCLLTEGELDTEKLGEPELRLRAAELFREIADEESRAADRVRPEGEGDPAR